MRLYSGMSPDFIRLNQNNQIAGLLEDEFFRQMGFRPSHSEVMSWRNSLLRLAITIDKVNLHDHGILVEYQLPNTSQRIDCLICGNEAPGRPQAVLVELKQWDFCTLSTYDSARVMTWVGGGNREVLHPSVQASLYRDYLKHYHTAFYEQPDPVSISACSYLHNYRYDPLDPLFDKRFRLVLEDCPAYTSDHTSELESYLELRLRAGMGGPILSRIEKSTCRPSKKLMQHVSSSIRAQLKEKIAVLPAPASDYILLDDQMLTYDTVMSIVKSGLHKARKQVLIVKGGPGTGKSVIALKLLADMNGMGINAQYATGSKSFTETLRRIVGNPASYQFKYFLSYGESLSNAIDVLILDEAHRIRERTVLRTRRSTGKLQIEEILNAGKVCVFFIDDLQVVKPDEIGSVAHIREHAKKFGANIIEFGLQAQFRCAGSDAFVNWIDNTLQIRRTANALWESDSGFEFKILASPFELEESITEKVKGGATGRVTAGFCWPWSKELNPDGSLKDDVVIESYKRPWNARYDAVGLKSDIPKAQFWAYDPKGLGQIGCIYTAQGFEFDYVGVIVGPDIKFDFETGSWVGNPTGSKDPTLARDNKSFLSNIKNRYRVLMTRAHRGCYVHFVDKEVEKFFRSRIVGKIQ